MLSKRPLSIICSQISGIRYQESGVRSQESGVKSQEYDVYNLLQYTIIFFILITVLLNNCFIEQTYTRI
jgi:hypothetical protein